MPLFLLLLIALLPASDGLSLATISSPEGVRLFNTRIQPALIEHCHECHAGAKKRGGLHVDSLEALLIGGHDFGPAIIPGDRKHSSLLQALRYEGDSDLNMPPKYQLDAALIRDFERWVELGAPWPQAQTAIPAVAPPLLPFLGRLHPLVVHLPIAALMLALLAEVLAFRFGAAWRPATAFLVVLGCIGAGMAVLTGNTLAGNQPPNLLARHELLGWLTLVAAALSAGLLALHSRFAIPRWAILVCLIVTALLVAATGHYGGQMSWGERWLSLR